MTNPLARLEKRGLTLPVPPPVRAAYIPVARTGNLIFVSGQISEHQGKIITGHLGGSLNVEQGQVAASYAALNILSQIVHNGGIELDQITKFVKLLVLVSSTSDFTEQHLVANGGSELIKDILGDAGPHARSAFGVTSLPLGAAVEMEAIIEVAD